MIRRFNICIKKVFIDKDGNEKKQWLRVGNLTQFPANGDKKEGYKLDLYMFYNTQFTIFEDKPIENKEVEIDIKTGEMKQPAPNKTQSDEIHTSYGIDYPTETIDPNDIPF